MEWSIQPLSGSLALYPPYSHHHYPPPNISLANKQLLPQCHPKQHNLTCPGCQGVYHTLSAMLGHISYKHCRSITYEMINQNRIKKLTWAGRLENLTDPGVPVSPAIKTKEEMVEPCESNIKLPSIPTYMKLELKNWSNQPLADLPMSEETEFWSSSTAQAQIPSLDWMADPHFHEADIDELDEHANENEAPRPEVSTENHGRLSNQDWLAAEPDRTETAQPTRTTECEPHSPDTSTTNEDGCSDKDKEDLLGSCPPAQTGEKAHVDSQPNSSRGRHSNWDWLTAGTQPSHQPKVKINHATQAIQQRTPPRETPSKTHNPFVPEWRSSAPLTPGTLCYDDTKASFHGWPAGKPIAPESLDNGFIDRNGNSVAHLETEKDRRNEKAIWDWLTATTPQPPGLPTNQESAAPKQNLVDGNQVHKHHPTGAQANQKTDLGVAPAKSCVNAIKNADVAGSSGSPRVGSSIGLLGARDTAGHVIPTTDNHISTASVPNEEEPLVRHNCPVKERPWRPFCDYNRTNPVWFSASLFNGYAVQDQNDGGEDLIFEDEWSNEVRPGGWLLTHPQGKRIFETAVKARRENGTWHTNPFDPEFRANYYWIPELNRWLCPHRKCP